MCLPPPLDLDTVDSAWERLQGVLLLYFMGLLHATRQKTFDCKLRTRLLKAARLVACSRHRSSTCAESRRRRWLNPKALNTEAATAMAGRPLLIAVAAAHVYGAPGGGGHAGRGRRHAGALVHAVHRHDPDGCGRRAQPAVQPGHRACAPRTTQHVNMRVCTPCFVAAALNLPYHQVIAHAPPAQPSA